MKNKKKCIKSRKTFQMSKLEFKMIKKRNLKKMKLKELKNKQKKRKKEKMTGGNQKLYKKSRLKKQFKKMQKIFFKCNSNSCKNKMKFKKMLNYQYKREK